MIFQNKTYLITGASRGIGKAIGLRLAREGANIVILAKTTEPHPKLPGTIYSAADEMRAAGGQALPLAVDIRDEAAVHDAVAQAVAGFGGVDGLINNASAIFLADTLNVPMKRFDLMHSVNARGTFVCSQACLPHLIESAAAGRNPHILNLSPPLNLEERWFAPHLAYTMAKYGMSLCVLGMAAEFRERGVAVNALWPRTVVATAAVQNILGGDEMIRRSRTPEIVADAAYHILQRNVSQASGEFFLDEDVLRETGVEEFERYAVEPGQELIADFFI